MAELLAANQITIAKVLDGEQGIPGEPGADGKTSYFHIKYSAVSNPTSSSQMTEEPSVYIGTYVDFTEADSTDPKKYTWSRFEGIQGEKGEQGIPGIGTDGKTSYLHIAYATSADGSKGFSISESANKTYIGQYTDFISTDSTDHTKYAWTKIKGETGGDGYSPTVTTGTSSDGSTTVTVTNKDGSTTTTLVDGTARVDIDTLSDKTRSGYIETLSGSGFVQSTKTEDGGTAEVIVYGKSVQDGTPWIGTEVDSAPYLNRAMPSQSNDYNRESLKIVGGTVAWNQRANVLPNETKNGLAYSTDNGKISITGTVQGAPTYGQFALTQDLNFKRDGRKYLILLSQTLDVGISGYSHKSRNAFFFSRTTGTDWGGYVFLYVEEGETVSVSNLSLNIFDLTKMFGSTIADYIYSLEQSQAGAGVAWFKKLFPNDYYTYNAGELLSVEGLSAHVMRDADNNVIGNYPLDSSLTLRGIPKLDASNNLYYDGDEYTSDGKVKRKYGVVDLGTLEWSNNHEGTNAVEAYNETALANLKGRTANIISNKLITATAWSDVAEYAVRVGSDFIAVKVPKTVASNATQVKEWLTNNSVYLVYELATPTTETATPYTNPQIVDPDGTEEFVSTGILPVGHNSTYLLVCPISVCDNVSVSVKGKNLFDINKIVPNNMFVENGELHLANASGGNDNIQNGQKLSDLANLEVGETYTLSANSTYSNKVIYLNTSEKDWAFGTSTVITQEDLDSRIGWYGNGAIISNIQIELGSTATDYEPYQAKTATLSDIVLRSTPDGTRDRLFKDTDGLWKVERNCAYISSYNGESITTSYYSNTGELSTGASVVYALEGPTYEILSDSIQAELNALTTYNPITNVFVSAGVTPDIDVSFWTRDYRAKSIAENAQADVDSIKKRVVIGDDSVDIVDSTGKLLASYGDVKIELGKNAVSSIIEMCGGMARVSARYGGLTTIYSSNGGYQTTLDYDFNETTFKSKVGSNYGFYEFSYSGGVWECSYSGNNAGYVRVNLSDYGITLKTASVNEYAGITINYWNGSETKFINADTTKTSRKLILGLAESGTADNLNYANIEIERSENGNVEQSKINLLTVHDGANVAAIYLNNGDIALDASGEVRINNIPLDYIVEQGTYIGWKYRKWNSGIAECFGYISLGSISVSAVNNVYRGTATVTLPGIFNDIPSNVHITNGNPLSSVISINGIATDADHVSVYVWKVSSAAADDVSASFHVIGTWK